MNQKTILTGLRANNQLTIGNYFGAMLPMVDMAKKHADEYKINMFIPDLHSFTTEIDHTKLYDQVINTAKMYLASGLENHNNVLMYRQSFISAHSELTWILDCYTGVGEMNRMTQFKEKSNTIGDERVSMGLFNYPVLMASDILLYQANFVPVGDDQTQHLEFTRDLAFRFNAKFGEVFVVPESVKDQHQFFGKDQGLRIKDLVNPAKKMSKSDESDKGVLFLTDDIDLARKKIMSASTDSLGVINYNPETQAGITNLIDILSLVSGQKRDDVITKYQGKSEYGAFKTDVADAVCEFLSNFQTKLAGIDDSQVINMLEDSEAKANNIAKQTLQKVQIAVGLRR